MISFSNFLKSTVNRRALILDTAIPLYQYCPIDLSVYNTELNNYNVQNPTQCQAYIDSVLRDQNAQVAFGGYLEKRNLYGDKSNFVTKAQPRNIHLGMDFWTLAGTEVITPLDGTVHSFQNNTTIGDYGPTIILKHKVLGFTFHTLYGHLSVESLENLFIGKQFSKGTVLATLGTTDINVNYAPHLHFQIIKDLEGKEGDYPGVCAVASLAHYSENCPDPSLLVRIGS